MIRVRDIQQVIADDFGISAKAMRSSNRAWSISHPRQYAMLLARELTGLSLPNIGRQFHRDHSTVLHGIRAAKERISRDRNLALKLEARSLLIRSKFGA